MPKVPQQKGPTETLQVVADPRAHAVNLGPSPFSNSLEEVARVVDDIYKRKVKADSSDALLKYEKGLQSLMYAQGEGYAYLRGKDAVDRSTEVLKKLDDLKNQYADSLEMPEARQQFLQVAEAHALRYREQILTHADKESRFYQGKVLNAEVDNAVTNAGLFYGDQKNMLIEKQRGLEAINEALQLQGLDSDPDIVLSHRQEFLDSFHASAVKSAIGVKDLDGAERLLKEAEKEVSPKTKIALEEGISKLKESLTYEDEVARAQAAAGEVWSPDTPLGEMESKIYSRKDLSGKEKKAAIADLRLRYRDYKQDQRDMTENLYRDAYDSANSGVDPDTLPDSIKSRFDPAMRELLKRVYRRTVEESTPEISEAEQNALDEAEQNALDEAGVGYWFKLTPEERRKVGWSTVVSKYHLSDVAQKTIYRDWVKLLNQSDGSKGAKAKEHPFEKFVDRVMDHAAVKSVTKAILADYITLGKRMNADKLREKSNIERMLRGLIAVRLQSVDPSKFDENEIQTLADALYRTYKDDNSSFPLVEMGPDMLLKIRNRLNRMRESGELSNPVTIPLIVKLYREIKRIKEDGDSGSQGDQS